VKPLPAGLSYSSALLPATDVRFLSDETCRDAAGARLIDQQIFDEALAMIASAERLVLVDMFLFNEFLGAGPEPHRRLCEELTAALIARKRAAPALRVVLITDPVNTVYGGLEARHLSRLKEAGAEVVLTRLDRLRDSNPAWSSLWRPLAKPWGNSAAGGWLASPFGAGEVPLRSWLALFNFKANHRKVVVADARGELRALVTSANPHDGSSAHANVGVAFGGPAARAVLEAEQAVLDFSGGRQPSLRTVPLGLAPPAADPRLGREVRVQVVTEKAIADAAEAMINGAEPGDALDVVMFYLSDRPIVRALKEAALRGVTMRVILDPNKDAFGRVKDGMPNRQVARELVAAGVPVRWAVTSGEQMHSKLLLVTRPRGTAELLLGSANFTRRNVRDYNLEADVRLAGGASAPALREARDYVERLWANGGGRTHTADYQAFRDDSRRRAFWYRLQEATGLCTW
jgi:phosphatidylserine/phosphatidylglycerophosphate/cardiolipin synthase-like enzyme